MRRKVTLRQASGDKPAKVGLNPPRPLCSQVLALRSCEKLQTLLQGLIAMTGRPAVILSVLTDAVLSLGMQHAFTRAPGISC